MGWMRCNNGMQLDELLVYRDEINNGPEETIINALEPAMVKCREELEARNVPDIPEALILEHFFNEGGLARARRVHPDPVSDLGLQIVETDQDGLAPDGVL